MHKLLYITNQICGPGGLERVLSIKTSSLVDTFDYEIHILTLNQGNKSLFYNFNKKIKYHDVIVKGNSIQYFNNYRKGIKSVIKKVNPEIIIVCDDGMKGLLLPIIIKKNCPMIYERHVSKNIEIKRENSILNRIANTIKFMAMNFGGKFYDQFIVLTNGNKNEWNIKNIMVIPNPLSFFPDDQSTLKNKKVLAVGKQSFQKGYDRLLKSWSIVVDKHPDWELDIYGTINESENLDNLASDLKITQTVNFYQPIKQIAEKYKEASIYVMSSRYEGFGMVLTEAMAYGVPCISFDCPHGPSDIITNNYNGFLVENGNTVSFAERIITLIENENKRKLMGEAARKSIDDFLPEKVAAIWDSLFKSTIEKTVH